MLLSAYGLLVDCEVPLPGLRATPAAGDGRDLTARLAPADEIAAAWSGPATPVARVTRTVDERPLIYERGARGDLLMRWGDDEGVFHIDVGERLLRCAGHDPVDPRWRRVLLDSVLASSALALGADALHAGAVLAGGGAVAVAAGTSAGKTSLVVELVARGYPLLGDDILALSAVPDAGPVAFPAPAMMSVAVGGPSSAKAAGLGAAMAQIDDELWLAVDHAATEPAPLSAVVLLDRRSGAALEVVAIAPTPTAILPHLLESSSDPARLAARFQLAGDIAQHATLLRLSAPPEVDPAGLADALATVLESIEPARSPRG